MSLSPRGTVITIPREVEIKVHRGHKGFWTLLEKLAGQLTDGQQPWLSYKQPPSPPWSTRLNDLIPYITIPLTISPYSIDITLTNECETDSLAVMIPGEQSKKQGEPKRKGYCIRFYSEPAKLHNTCIISALSFSHCISYFGEK